MKKFCILFVACVCGIAGFSQSMKEFLSAREATFFGVDFSHVRLIGSGFEDPTAVRDEFFPAVNNVVFTQREKFDMGKFFRIVNMYYDNKTVTEQNKLPKPTDLVYLNSSDATHLDSAQVAAMTESYKNAEKSGYGIVFFAEALNKMDNYGSFWVTVFEMKTGKIIHTERIQGEPSGFGLRNYWSGSVYRVCGKIDEEIYTTWKTKFGE